MRCSPGPGTLSQVLVVERELTRREADLESLESQRKVLADQTTLATIDLTLVTPKAAPPPPPPARHLGFVTGVIAGWHGLVNTVVVAATAIGAILPFALPLLAARRPRHCSSGGDFAVGLAFRRSPTQTDCGGLPS